jgi:hypothetical protein
LTRCAAVPLMIVMVMAKITAKLTNLLETFLGFEEVS